jgi:hypothetical protein
MRAPLLITAACLALVAAAAAQQSKPATPSSSEMEAKVKKSWEDFKTKNKTSFAADLAEGFREVEDDGDGARDMKTEVAEIDQLELTQYALKNFDIKPIGTDGVLVTYAGEYSGTAAGQPVHQKAVYSEVWVRRGNTWKVLYIQETNVK